MVGPIAPQVTIVAPVAGQPFQFGQQVSYQITVLDDKPIDCSRVTMNYILGHDGVVMWTGAEILDWYRQSSSLIGTS